MPQTMTAPADAFEQLSEKQLDKVSGGFKVDPNYKGSPDVIDARGGSISVLGYIVTWDPAGNVTSVTPPPR